MTIFRARSARDDDEDEEFPPRRRRRFDNDDDDDRLDRRRQKAQTRAQVQLKTRIAAGLMFATAFFLLINCNGNILLNLLSNRHIGPPPGVRDVQAFEIGQYVGSAFMFIVGLVVTGLIAWGGIAFIQLSPKGIVITAIVFNFLLLLLLAIGLILNLFVVAAGDAGPVPLRFIWPTICMNSVSCVLNLAAGVTGISVLAMRDVARAFRRKE